MIGVPTLTEVRAWVNVPATSVSDADLQAILDAELAIQARLCRLPDEPASGPVTATLDDMTATVTVDGGPPAVTYWVAWGDTFSDEVVLDDNGDGTVSHVYAEAGDWVAVVYNSTANVILYYPFTTPGSGSTRPQATYPAALARACLRRCQRQVAARNVPLGVLGVESDGFGPMNLPAWDAEIARLEASYRIPVIA